MELFVKDVGIQVIVDWLWFQNEKQLENEGFNLVSCAIYPFQVASF